MKPAHEPVKIAIEPYLDALRDRKITGREVARLLGVTESWVSKTLKAAGVTRSKKPSRAEKKALRAARLAHRLHAVATMNPKEAAEACNVHPRTIARLLKKKA